MHHVLEHLDLVGLLDQGRGPGPDLRLAAGAHLVVVHLHVESDPFQGEAHGRTHVEQGVHRRHREVAALEPDPVAAVALPLGVRGAPMTSKCTAQLLADLGVTRSLSRPQVSDDNPFSEAQFKTLKYHPGFPGRFDDIAATTAFCRSFFPWYNTEHRHAGIAMLTPHDVHYGQASQILEKRERTLRLAWSRHPERFVNGTPKPQPLPQEVWINPPAAAATARPAQ